MEGDPRDQTAHEAERLDIERMTRVKAGDTAAFEELVATHQARVIAVATRMLGDPHAAEDAAQQVFLQIWRAARRYQPSAKFTTYLFKITRNVVLNELRRRARKPVAPFPQDDHESGSATFRDETQPSPDRDMLETELREAVDAAIAALPENQRLALVLLRYEGLSYEEIAQAMRTSLASVKSLIFRARTELRERLRRYLSP